MRERFVETLILTVKSAYGVECAKEELLQSITIPKIEYGDICSSIAFKIAKTAKESPDRIAQKIVSAMQKPDGFSQFTNLAGYINGFFDSTGYSKSVIEAVDSEKGMYGSGEAGKGIRVIIEFGSVNPNKPWHIGHLRNELLGDCISNIMEFCSYSVQRIDYIDDLGLQCAESLWGYMNISSKPDKKMDFWLGEQYVEVNKRIEDPKVKEEVDKLLVKMEDSSTDEAKRNRKLTEQCVAAQYETAGNYGVVHDLLVWESDIVREKFVEHAIDSAKNQKILKEESEGKYKGCLVFDMTGVEGADPEDPKKVLVRSNGAATYIAKDYAFHLWKLGMINNTFRYAEFEGYEQGGRRLFTTSSSGDSMPFGGADASIDVIGSAQKLQQMILRTIIDSTPGHKPNSIMHISYGEVGVEGGSLSGRRGGWIGKEVSYTADDLLKETKAKVEEILKGKEIGEDVSTQVALGAIKFEFLKFAPERKITFSWQKALDFTGDSGPYCMYTHARASKILMKETPKKVDDRGLKGIERDRDFEVLRIVGLAPEYVEKACREYRPNVLAGYLLDLCSAYSKFYEKMPVLTGGEAKNVRLAITSAARQTIANMLSLMGMNALESM